MIIDHLKPLIWISTLTKDHENKGLFQIVSSVFFNKSSHYISFQISNRKFNGFGNKEYYLSDNNEAYEFDTVELAKKKANEILYKKIINDFFQPSVYREIKINEITS